MKLDSTSPNPEPEYGSPIDDNTPIEIVDTTTHKYFDETRYAIDFICPVGTPVKAARAGTVVLIKSDSNILLEPVKWKELVEKAMERVFPTVQEIKADPSLGVDLEKAMRTVFADSTNRVLNKHDDGTVAEYVHFGEGKVTVKGGQRVEKGDLIGHTGFSGFMDQPHLHFNVMKSAASDNDEPHLYFNVMEGEFSATGVSIRVRFEQKEIQDAVRRKIGDLTRLDEKTEI